MMTRMLLAACVSLLCTISALSQLISEKNVGGSFPLVSAIAATSIYTDDQDHWLIEKAASLFQRDIEMVTGKRPDIIHSVPASASNIIIIGSIDKSLLIQQLIQQKKLNVVNKGKWEGYTIQLVSNPLKGLSNALVIAGDDRRGTAYGVFEAHPKP